MRGGPVGLRHSVSPAGCLNAAGSLYKNIYIYIYIYVCNRNIYYDIFLFQFFQATVQTGCGDINLYFCSLRRRCKLATEIAIVGRPPVLYRYIDWYVIRACTILSPFRKKAGNIWQRRLHNT